MKSNRLCLCLSLATLLSVAWFAHWSFASAEELTPPPQEIRTPMEWIVVSNSGGFETSETHVPFYPWGFNYDHDSQGRLLEAYWHDEALVQLHLERMAEQGARVIRVHLQVSAFLDSPTQANARSQARLQSFVDQAERLGLRLNLTGLGCYHKGEVPDWYNELSREERWEAQAVFWRAVAGSVKDEPAVFCFDLMNEPVVAGAKREPGSWLGPEFGDKSFVQFISLDPEQQTRPAIAKAWIDHLVKAIREVDSRHLITVGLVPWSLDRPGLTSGFVPDEVCQSLDFISVHLYPETGKLDEAAQTLVGFQIGKPLVVEEYFPLRCSFDDATQFIVDHRESVAGWISFHWGASHEELLASGKLQDAIVKAWLDRFSELMTESN